MSDFNITLILMVLCTVAPAVALLSYGLFIPAVLWFCTIGGIALYEIN